VSGNAWLSDKDHSPVTNAPDAPHDELPCVLAPADEPACGDVAVVSVIDRSNEAVWGCELHAVELLDAVDDARINQVGDWEACRRLQAQPWNHRSRGLER